jgi:hypothetical protein
MRLAFSERSLVALNFLLIAGSAYFAARSVNDLLATRLIVVPHASPIAPAPPPSPSLSRQAYDLIVQRDIFNHLKVQPAVSPPPEAVVMDLHLKLVGTSHLTRTKPFAILEDDNTHIQTLYKLGDQVPDAGDLASIEKAEVVINHNGHLVTLKIPEEPLSSGVSNATRLPNTAPGLYRRARGHRGPRRFGLKHYNSLNRSQRLRGFPENRR